MGNTQVPYTLDIQPGARPGTFQWSIRKNGKMTQRSDKFFKSIEDAQKDGEKAVEHQFLGSAGIWNHRR